MFEALSENLEGVFNRLTGRGALSEKDVDAALQEVRRALLEADVALPVVKDFMSAVKPQAVGANVLKSVKPGQQVVKIVHDELAAMLGDAAPLSLEAVPPVPVMMVGLQGSGKTTSTAKIANRLKNDKKKALMASLDTSRPAAMEQLRVLGEQTGIETLPIVDGEKPVSIARRAVEAGRLGGFDVVLLDTAGRTNADEALMAELAEIEAAAGPREVLLVADSLTGQEAVAIAEKFSRRVTLTGIVLTRTEGDGRGGAALSMRHVTGVPIKFLGTGEGADKIEVFDAQRIAGRILGMGDVVGLVEKAAETLDAEKAEKMAARMKKGQFTLEDMAEQLKQMRRMGGMAGVLSMLPGNLLGGRKAKQLGNLGMDDRELVRQAAIVSSMTRAEKDNPKLLNASRKKRIAAGSGTQVQDVNKLVKMHRQMADMMKKLGKGGLSGMMGALGGGGSGADAGSEAGNDPLRNPSAGLASGGQLPDFDRISKQFGASSSPLSNALSGGGGKTGMPPRKK